MSTPSAQLLVCADDETAIIKLSGRANFSTSVQFKAVVGELHDRGSKRFILDLTECATMDSTFLGVLAGLALKLSNGSEHPASAVLELQNPNDRILDLLDNLGIAQFFRRLDHAPAIGGTFNPAPPTETPATKEALSRTCLEAHETLMALNPDNIPKFKDVTQFLAEDLKKARP